MTPDKILAPGGLTLTVQMGTFVEIDCGGEKIYVTYVEQHSPRQAKINFKAPKHILVKRGKLPE